MLKFNPCGCRRLSNPMRRSSSRIDSDIVPSGPWCRHPLVPYSSRARCLIKSHNDDLLDAHSRCPSIMG